MDPIDLTDGSRPPPRDLTEQFLEFASTGRLSPLAHGSGSPVRRSALTWAVTFAAGAFLLAGVAGVIEATRGQGHASLLPAGALCVLAGAVALVSSVRLTRRRTGRSPAIEPAIGAVLPPELIRAGHWIHRGGAWLRVLEVGRHGRGEISALLSSGEVVDLTTPTIVAGGHFHRLPDPVAGLRR
ncbi:MAG: hypothetical protein ACE5GB_03420 [Acidimicrobiales bacterium]